MYINTKNNNNLIRTWPVAVDPTHHPPVVQAGVCWTSPTSTSTTARSTRWQSTPKGKWKWKFFRTPPCSSSRQLGKHSMPRETLLLLGPTARWDPGNKNTKTQTQIQKQTEYKHKHSPTHCSVGGMLWIQVSGLVSDGVCFSGGPWWSVSEWVSVCLEGVSVGVTYLQSVFTLTFCGCCFMVQNL